MRRPAARNAAWAVSLASWIAARVGPPGRGDGRRLVLVVGALGGPQGGHGGIRLGAGAGGQLAALVGAAPFLGAPLGGGGRRILGRRHGRSDPVRPVVASSPDEIGMPTIRRVSS